MNSILFQNRVLKIGLNTSQTQWIIFLSKKLLGIFSAWRGAVKAVEKKRLISYCIPIAGWSSPVARRAHNPKVRGSNPLPATKEIKGLQMMQAFFIDCKPLYIGYHLQIIDWYRGRAVS